MFRPDGGITAGSSSPDHSNRKTAPGAGETLEGNPDGKKPVVGRTISHAHNVRARRFEPNLQRVRAMINGGVRRIRVCSRCLRSNKVTKAA